MPEERLRRGAAAVQPAPLLPDRHETGVAQEPDVSGDGGRVETEEVDEVADAEFALAESGEHAKPAEIGESATDTADGLEISTARES